MKNFNNLKMVSSFREISNALDVISNVIRIFTFILVILQGILLIKDSKKNIPTSK